MASLDRPREADTADQLTDPRHARLYVLGTALTVHGFAVELDSLHLDVSAPDRPERVLEIWCQSRVSDGGRLWFVRAGGVPIAEASDISGALMVVKHEFGAGR